MMDLGQVAGLLIVMAVIGYILILLQHEVQQAKVFQAACVINAGLPHIPRSAFIGHVMLLQAVNHSAV